MERRDITARLKFHKDLLVRGVGFALAAATVCGALAVGSALRGPSRILPQPAAAMIEQDGKDQTRVIAGGRWPIAHAVFAAAKISVWHPGKMENAPVGESAETSPPAASDGLPGEL